MRSIATSPFSPSFLNALDKLGNDKRRESHPDSGKKKDRHIDQCLPGNGYGHILLLGFDAHFVRTVNGPETAAEKDAAADRAAIIR